jgi:hypothetical protein
MCNWNEAPGMKELLRNLSGNNSPQVLAQFENRDFTTETGTHVGNDTSPRL